MRFFEGVIFATSIITIALFAKEELINKLIFKFMSVCFILIFMAHLFLEGLRWQLYPLYFLLIATFALIMFVQTGLIKNERIKNRKIFKKVTLTFMVFMLIVSSVAAYAFPVYKMPKPKGKYKIGTISYDITDESRKAIYSNDLNSYRKIKIQLWYPAGDTKGLNRVPWLEDGTVVARQVSKVMGMPDFIFSHTSLIKSNSYKNAPVSDEKDMYPVVVISHGWTGFRNLHTDVAEMLASNGYIVVSIDHTYGSAVTVFNDGEIAYLKKEALPKREITPDFLNYANTLVNTYAGDINVTLNQLEEYNSGKIESILRNKMDLTNLGLLGHSTGGGAGVTTALKDNRIKAVMGLDAWVEPIKENDIKNGLTIPSLFLRSEQWEQGLNNKNLLMLLEKSSSDKALYEIYGVKHMDFSMAYMYSPLSKYLNITGKLDGWKGAAIQQDFILNFYNKYLKSDSQIDIEGLDVKYEFVKKVY